LGNAAVGAVNARRSVGAGDAGILLGAGDAGKLLRSVGAGDAGILLGAGDAGKLLRSVGAGDAGILLGVKDAGESSHVESSHVEESRHVDAVGTVDADEELGLEPLEPFDVFVTSPQLQNEIGIGLIDTGAQESLVKSKSLKKSSFKAQCKEIHVNIQGINGDSMHIDKGIMLQVNNSKKMLFYVVESLPRNLDLIMGQEWLMENDYVMVCPKIILPFSESVVKMPTRERGIRFVDKQELLPGIYCSTSLSLCEGGCFQCLIVNMTPFPVTRLPIPRLEKPPVFVTGSEVSKLCNANERIVKLDEKLRLEHVVEGADEVRALCREYHDVFKLPGDKLTVTSAAMHSICTPSIPEGRAITLKNYRLAEAHKQEVNDQVEQMIRDEVIAPSTSEWNFPLVIVPKKIDATGKRKWRVCVDFRKLNELSIGDSFPLPNIQDILDKVGRARYFSALDCASGFHQIPIREEDKRKTAFSTPTGHFEYLRMPFGLKAAPATFQRMMNSVLRDSIGDRCFVYMDDVLILGETLQEHHAKLREDFEQFRRFNVKIEPDKCEFLRPELAYLGHIISKEGVKPDPKKIEAVVQFPVPKREKDIKAFLGLTGYYRKFIADYSTVAKPLTKLLMKDVPWTWTSEEQKSF
jgi:hypothetical protein